MKRFEYEITRHQADTYKQVVYFCTETGECTLDEVPDEETKMLSQILNERGNQGWELIQVSFGKDGMMTFWKRKVKEKKK